MSLKRYAGKRDLKRSPEPPPRVAQRVGSRFCVQQHAARRLHYDLRLELDGVLKSWAVTRGPSLVAGERRLAVEVEDHPLAYGTFEGTIPSGEYGAGRVLLWDKGRWTPQGDARAGLRKGHLRFTLHGKKLSGLFDLVRMERKAHAANTNWLLIKAEDSYARRKTDADILTQRPESVKSGRRIEDIAPPDAAGAPKTATATVAPKKTTAKAARAPAPRRKSRAPRPPAFIPFALATAAAKAPQGRHWLHEVKFDGYRLQARIDHGRVTLRTHRGLDWSTKFPKLVGALRGLAVTQAILDGEVVAEVANAASSFSELQSRLKAGRDDALVYYVFDLLHRDGQDLTPRSLRDRKDALAQIVPPDARGTVRLSETFDTDGETLKEHACRIGFEGIVSKRATARYRSGRSNDWLKIKCVNRQEFLIVGYQRSTTARRAIGSLALAVRDGDRIVFAGRVGTGFSTAVAEELWSELEPMGSEIPTAQTGPAADTRNIRWVAPRLVADVEFREWTPHGHIRHAVFQGLRRDKAPQDVVREAPTSPAPASQRTGRRAGRRAEPPETPGSLTHPDRIYWADAGISKQGLADYYAQIWPWIAPHVTGRPLSLLRCPGGTEEPCFFQKHAWAGMDRKAVALTRHEDEDLLSISDLAGALALVQAGVLELHPWGSRLETLECPDRLIFDLDPDDAVAWPMMEAAALDLRARLQEKGLTSFVKTTGGKGLHIAVPISPVTPWSEAKEFTRSIARAMAKDAPTRFVATISKAARRGKIFVDYLRNSRGSTAVAAYSPRARAGAPVSTPIEWDEIRQITPSHFTVQNVRRRLSALSRDPWAAIATLRQRLPR